MVTRELKIPSKLHSDRSSKSSPRPISTSQLNPLLDLHFWPINLVVYKRSYSLTDGRPYLGAGFALRCFQRLSDPDVANQQCSWRNNWHTRGLFAPVLSY